jgi:hypothetical protein
MTTKQKAKRGKTAVVIAWREGETELHETIVSATNSLRKGDVVIPVEDKTGAGPAQTRHRGIVAAKKRGADVICIVDAHMQFDGKVLQLMAAKVRRDKGGLLCALCHHNKECSFDAEGGACYAGADLHYKGRDQNGRQALLWKWSATGGPGPCACVGGACYVFLTSWYFRVGQPLAALPSWGCDEEALSISAWLSGVDPTVFNGHVAHRWRASPPWRSGASPIVESRAAMICAVVTDPADRRDLLKYQGTTAVETPEVTRWAKALLKCKRSWQEWRDTVPVGYAEKPKPPRANYSADENARHCHKCGSGQSKVTDTKVTGRVVLRYRRCLDCGAKRVSRDIC